MKKSEAICELKPITERKTKIVCSIGPSCDNDDTIRKMIKEGMNVARFNFSHGSYEWHKNAIERIKRISAEIKIPVAILLDTKGPEIRTGITDEEIELKEGQTVEIVTNNSPCTNATNEAPCRISISWKDAAKKLSVGNKILIADGLIELMVERIVDSSKIVCRSLNSGKFGSRKNVNIIGVSPRLPIINEKDKDDLKFSLEMDVDFIAASFISSESDVLEVRNFLNEIGSDSKIIAKIENEEGLLNIEKITDVADGIMVARGDMGVQLPLERIPLAQKAIIRTCRKKGKFVITATQMLESMIENPRPTRAELTDVANAVFDGSDAVMLSGETACGKHPIEAVRTIALITRTAENSTDYKEEMRTEDSTLISLTDIGTMVAHSAYKLARNIKADAIITPTHFGNTARILSNFRPEQPIIAVTPTEKIQRQLLLNWGVTPLLSPLTQDSETMLSNAINAALIANKIGKHEKIIICAGISLESARSINMIQLKEL